MTTRQWGQPQRKWPGRAALAVFAICLVLAFWPDKNATPDPMLQTPYDTSTWTGAPQYEAPAP